MDSFGAGFLGLLTGVLLGGILIGVVTWGYVSPPAIYSGQVNGVVPTTGQVQIIIGHNSIVCKLAGLSGDQQYALTSLRAGTNATIAATASADGAGGHGCIVVRP